MFFIWLKASDNVKLFRLPWKFTKRNQCHGKNCLQDFCLTNVSSYWWKEKLEEIKKCIIILLSLDHRTVWDFWFYEVLMFTFFVPVQQCWKILNLTLLLIIGFLTYINGKFHWDRILKVSKFKIHNPKFIYDTRFQQIPYFPE